jgi:hypothetical protein
MYECLEMHDWFEIWQGSFTEADKTLEYWARSGSRYNIYIGILFGETVVERRIKTMAEGNKTCREGTLEGSLIQVAVARRVSAG